MIEVPQVIREYIDGLSDVERDRIVVAQDWDVSGSEQPYGNRPACLVEHAKHHRAYPSDECHGFHATVMVGGAFDQLCDDSGTDAAVAAIKAYAARNNTIDTSASVSVSAVVGVE